MAVNLNTLIKEYEGYINDDNQALNGLILFNDSSRVSAESKAETQDDMAALNDRIRINTALLEAAKEALGRKSYEPPVLTAKQTVIDELKVLLGHATLATGLLKPPVELPIDASAETDA